MSIKIYRDDDAKAIFIEDANGAQFLNSLHATVDNNVVSIADTAKGFELVSAVDHTELVDFNGVGYGVTATEACDALNAIFTTSGSTGQLPVITSNTTINVTAGDTINYELTADYGVGYEWTNLPSGLITVDGNIRKLIGGSSLSAGTYTPTVKAINYFGEDSEIVTIEVATPPFSNTKSVKFENLDYLSCSASALDPVLGRPANGAGASDAWSISFWIKPSNNANNQGIFLFGGVYSSHEAVIDIRYVGNKDSLWIRYGTTFNRVHLQTPDNSLPANSWSHCVITYDGGTTGADSGSINSYYSRFNMFINGVSQVTTGTANNFGYTGSISASVLQVGKSGQNQYLRGVNLDELAVWSSDESSNIADIYNSGTPSDLSLLTSSPVHFWRMGDGDTFPTLRDIIGSADFTMNNMTVADIVNDVP